jgi:hypothetical protein
VYVGVSRTYLAWIETPSGLPVELERLGLVPGWNALQLYGTRWPHVVPHDALTITVPEATTTLTLSGTWEAPAALAGTHNGRDTGGGGTSPEPPGPLRLAVVPRWSLQGGSLPATLLHDAPLTARWSIVLDGAPPEDHGASGGGDRDKLLPTLLTSIVEVPLAYTDDEEDGAFSAADAVVHDVCDPVAAGRVTAVWAQRTSNLAATFLLDGRHGWIAVVEGAVTAIRTGVLSDLAVGVGCVPPDDRDPGDGRP